MGWENTPVHEQDAQLDHWYGSHIYKLAGEIKLTERRLISLSILHIYLYMSVIRLTFWSMTSLLRSMAKFTMIGLPSPPISTNRTMPMYSPHCNTNEERINQSSRLMLNRRWTFTHIRRPTIILTITWSSVARAITLGPLLISCSVCGIDSISVTR